MFGDQATFWPIHPKPLEGEILSSWLARIGFGLNLSLSQLVKVLRSKDFKAGIDIDQIDDADVFAVVARGTGLSVNEVRQTGLMADEGRVFAQTLIRSPEWISPLLIPDGGFPYWAQSFCPSCLADDRIPYYRKYWRYAFHPVCPKHGLLTNRCPHCNAPYLYVGSDQRNGTNLASGVIGRCRACQNRISATTISGLDDRILDAVKGIQEELLAALESGWFQPQDGEPIHVCMYLRGLHLLTGIFEDPETSLTVRRWIGRESGLKIPDKHSLDWLGSVETREASIRGWILLLVSWLVEEWPYRFVEMMKATRMRPSKVLPRAARIPLWMAHPDIEELRQRGSGRSAEETSAARKLLAEKRHWAPTDAELRKFMDTGEIPEIKPIGSTLTPRVKALVEEGVRESELFHRELEQAAKDRKNAPRELYPHVTSVPYAPDSQVFIEEIGKKVPALRWWVQKKTAGTEDV